MHATYLNYVLVWVAFFWLATGLTKNLKDFLAVVIGGILLGIGLLTQF